MWAKGTENVLGDAPSRNPMERVIVRDLPVPAGPVKRNDRMMFGHPFVLGEEVQEMRRFLGELDAENPMPTVGRW